MQGARRAGRWLAGSRSSANRSSSRRAISCTGSTRVRAAASSIASGSPSSERHTSSTVRRVSSSSSAIRALGGGPLGEQGHRVGQVERREVEHLLPADPSGSWLVASTRTPGADASSARRRAATASATCSQLSSTSSRSVPCSRSVTAARVGVSSPRATPMPRPHRRVRGRGRLEPRQPRAAGACPRGRLERQPRLAHPGRARQRDQPGGRAAGSSSALQLDCRDRAARPDAVGRLPLTGPGPPTSEPPAGAGAAQRRVLRAATCCSSGGSSGPGSMPSSSASSRRTRRARGQGVALPAAAVELGDEQGPQPLAQRVGRDEVLELGDELAGGARGRPARPAVPPPGPAGSPPTGAGAGAPTRASPGTGQSSPRKSASPWSQSSSTPAGVADPRSAATCSASRSDEHGIDVHRVEPRACSRHPRRAPRPASPSARRSRDTFDCKVFGAAPCTSSGHRSSSSRSARTGVPAATRGAPAARSSCRPEPAPRSRPCAGRPDPDGQAQHLASIRLAGVGRTGLSAGLSAPRQRSADTLVP